MQDLLWPLIGGMLIGLSASAMLLLNGRVMGVSGIVGGLPAADHPDRLVRLSFLAGLVGAGAVLFVAMPGAFDFHLDRSLGAMALAGVLVGVGTRMGSGCTSGHGVCGLSRGSRRSMVSTPVFMASGAAIVFVVQHLLGGAA